MRVLGFLELKSCKGIRYSRMHIDRLERAVAFPKRVMMGSNTVAWVEEEIDAWLKAKADSCRQPDPAADQRKSRHRGKGGAA